LKKHRFKEEIPMAASVQSYNEMISELQKYISTVSRACEEMASAGSTCVANMEGDPAASSANAKVQTSVGRIHESLARASRIVSAMQEELEEIQRAAAIASDM
jgi:methyl-accepting chemotaxis protein